MIKPTNYREFKKYLKTIVLYQATNKRFKHWSTKRKATANFTMRQLANVTGLSKSTCHRYITKMRKEGLLGIAERRVHRNYRKSAMVFYYLKEVLNILQAKAKRKAYLFIKKMIDRELKSGTLRINLFHKFKEKQFKRFKYLTRTIDSPHNMIIFHGTEYNLNEIDLRKKDFDKIDYLNSKTVSNFFSQLLEKLK